MPRRKGDARNRLIEVALIEFLTINDKSEPFQVG